MWLLSFEQFVGKYNFEGRWASIRGMVTQLCMFECWAFLPDERHKIYNGYENSWLVLGSQNSASFVNSNAISNTVHWYTVCTHCNRSVQMLWDGSQCVIVQPTFTGLQHTPWKKFSKTQQLVDLDHSKKNCNGCANKAFRSAFVPYDGPCVHHNVFARVQTTSATYHEVWRGSGNLLSGFVLMKHLSIGDLMTVRCIPNNVWQSILSVESNLLALNDDLMWNITVEKSW